MIWWQPATSGTLHPLDLRVSSHVAGNAGYELLLRRQENRALAMNAMKGWISLKGRDHWGKDLKKTTQECPILKHRKAARAQLFRHALAVFRQTCLQRGEMLWSVVQKHHTTCHFPQQAKWIQVGESRVCLDIWE